MKKKLQFLGLGLFLLAGGSATAQINYTQDFEDDQHGWSLYEFAETSQYPCDGSGALNVNLYFDWDGFDGIYEAEADSPSLGVSDGGELTISFDYKLLNYPLTTIEATDSDTWGAVYLYYALDPSGPWTLLTQLNPEDHIASTDCATISGSFYPPAGSEVYVAIYAEHFWDDDDYYLFIDNFSAVQAAPVACAGTPANNTISATFQTLCGDQTTSTLSLNNPYFDSGISIQWQSSADNVTYTDIPAATGMNYGVAQTESTWYRAVITCTNSNLSVTTPALQLVNVAWPCYCTVAFPSGVEPITLVSFEGINNVTSAVLAGASAYQDFTTSIAAPVLLTGETYPIALEGNTGGSFTNHFTVFIDWNQDGDFNDEGEDFTIGTINSSTGVDGQQATGDILVPENAAIGNTRMRVVKRYSAAGTACNTTGYGQVEDYTVNVQSAASVIDFSGAAFRYYPNPVKDVLNISSVAGLQSVEVFNMLGQTVLSTKISGNETAVNTASLTPGSYVVKVTAEDASKNFKIVKQ